jgi:peroxiredoxin
MRILPVLILILTFSIFGFGQKRFPAENFSAANMTGKIVELNSLKGNIVVLTFWNTKCAICQSELPKLNQLAGRFKDKNVIFLGLTTENETKVENYVKKNPFSFDIIPNSFGILLKYAEKDGNGNISMGYPAHFVINKEGEIELKTDGFDKTDKLNSEINRLLSAR